MEKQSNTRLNMARKDPYVYSIAGLLLRTVYYIASIFMKTKYNIISLFDYLVDLIDKKTYYGFCIIYQISSAYKPKIIWQDLYNVKVRATVSCRQRNQVTMTSFTDHE